MSEEVDPISMNALIKVTVSGDDATVYVPEEIRITERLATSLNQALAARNLKLKHWALSEAQKQELLRLSNVVVQEQEEGEGD